MCGASASKDTTLCAHCGARLATVACPACFGMLFLGAKFCPHCGARAARCEGPDLPPASCPRCSIEMRSLLVGDTLLRECPACSGLWVDADALDRICSDSQCQTSLLGKSNPIKASGEMEKSIRYLPCPACRKLMNRVNFARCSSVVVDVCRTHGTWFDKHELQRIVQFIKQGGLDTARLREMRELEERRRRLERAEHSRKRDCYALSAMPDLYYGLAEAAGSILDSTWD